MKDNRKISIVNLYEDICKIRKLIQINENSEKNNKSAINYLFTKFNDINQNIANEIIGYAFATKNSKIFAFLLKKHGYIKNLKLLKDDTTVLWNGIKTTTNKINDAFENEITLYELGIPFLKKVRFVINDNDITDRLKYLSGEGGLNFIYSISENLSSGKVSELLKKGIISDKKKIETLKRKIENKYKYSTESILQEKIEKLKNEISERKYYLSEIDELEIIIPPQEIGISGNGFYKVTIENNKLKISRDKKNNQNDFTDKLTSELIINEIWNELQKYK